MNSKTKTGVAGLMSKEAKTFLESTARSEAPPLTAETIEIYRREARAAFAPRAERAVDRNGVVLDNLAIGGVACLRITPKEKQGDRRILYCFGGGYTTGSAFEDLIVAAPIARLTGAVVIAPEYPLAPEHPWPAATDAGYAVYKAMTATGPLALMGESAGGNMALTILQRARREGVVPPQALALLSPWCDLADGGDSLAFNDGRDPSLSVADIEAMTRLYAGGADRASPAISPIYGDFDADMPPTLITSGTRDLLMSQSVRLATVMRAAGAPVDLRLWDGLWHVFEFYDELPEAGRSLAEVAAFLGQRFEAG